MFVDAEYANVFLSALFADESAESNVGVGRRLKQAVYAYDIVLVFAYQKSKFLLLLLSQLLLLIPVEFIGVR